MSSSSNPRPNWSGFMQCCTTKFDNPSISTIDYLPMIDLNPNSTTCIYSTLLYVINQASKLNILTPSITFDQPLYKKAREITKAENLNIVILLGGFHTQMSFFGSIGYLMKGSGIADVFGEVYATNTVESMLSGKSYSRALRAHLMLQSALIDLLLDIVKEECDVDFKVFEELYEKALNGSLDERSVAEVTSSPIFKQVSEHLDILKRRLSSGSCTARLWLLYMSYIDVV